MRGTRATDRTIGFYAMVRSRTVTLAWYTTSAAYVPYVVRARTWNLETKRHDAAGETEERHTTLSLSDTYSCERAHHRHFKRADLSSLTSHLP